MSKIIDTFNRCALAILVTRPGGSRWAVEEIFNRRKQCSSMESIVSAAQAWAELDAQIETGIPYQESHYVEARRRLREAVADWGKVAGG